MHLILKPLARPPVTAWLTLTCVVSGARMELTPLSHVLFRLRNIILWFPHGWVVLGCPALALPFVLWFGGTFPLLQIHRSKVSFLFFELLLDFHSVSVHRAE